MRQATDLLGRFRGRAIVLIRGFTPTLTGLCLRLAARLARTLRCFGLGLGLALGRLDKRALARGKIVATGLRLRIAALLVLVAAIAVAVTSRSSGSPSPKCSAATAYSPPIVAPKYGGSSEASVRGIPASRRIPNGCSP